MWGLLGLLLLVGAVTSINSEPAWELGQEYKYVLRTHTFSVLGQEDKIQNQSSGIVISAILTLQVTSSDTLVGNLANAQYAQVHKVLPEGIESISDNKLDYQTLPLRGENFTIRLKHGMIRQLLLDPQTPIWEVNLLKSIASQLQLDTMGENAIPARGVQIPTSRSPFGLYTVFEQSIGGNCEVLYDIAPLSEEDQLNQELVPNQKLVKNNEMLIDIKKTKNYQVCRDLKVESLNMDRNAKVVSRLSTSRNIVSGSLKKFTIQSSLMTSNIYVSLDRNSGLGMVLTRSNLTLRTKREIRRPVEISSKLMTPVNDLMYSFECSMDSLGALEERQQKLMESSSKKLKNLKYVLRGFDKSSSSSSSSSEELNRSDRDRSSSDIQLSMDKVPRSSLLFDVGCAARQLTDEQRINKVREIIKDLIDDFRSSDKDLPSTPPKFLHVVKLMRTLGVESLNRLKQHLQEDNMRGVTPQLTAMNVFYNALSQVGTEPALLLIMQAIEKKQLQDSELEIVIRDLDKAVRFVTNKIIENVCKMMNNSNNVLREFAPLVCGKLLRKATIKRSSNIYVSDSDVKKLLSRYISVMDRLLLQALKNNDVSQAYALVLGLGNTADPMILSVLEPYLEGTYVEDSLMRVKKFSGDSSEERISSEKDTSRNTDLFSREDKGLEINVSKQLRKLMVMVLGEVIKYNPSKSRTVALKLYLNRQEDPEVRCIAANFYVMSDPSMIRLTHMVKVANMDSNREVSSCVKSCLVNVANRQPLSRKQSLESKARTALRYMIPVTPTKMWTSLIERVSSLFVGRDVNPILGNGNTIVPSSAYLRMEPYNLRSNMQTILFAYDVSDMRQLMERIMSGGKQKTLMMDRQTMSQDFEQIMHELKIKMKDEKRLEGFMYMEDMFGSLFYSFNDSRLDADLKKLRETFLENKPYNRIRMDVYDELLSLPVETGFPFIFTIERPTTSVINALGVRRDSDVIEERVKINLLYSSKIQYKVGFVTPFDQKKYVCGIDNSVSLVAPLALDVDRKQEKDETRVSVRLRPSQQMNTNNKLLVLSNTPFTSIYNILDYKPVLLCENTHLMQLSSELKKDAIHLGAFSLVTERDAASCRNIKNLLTNMVKPSFDRYNIALQTSLSSEQKILIEIVYVKRNSDEEDSNGTQEDVTPGNVTKEDVSEEDTDEIEIEFENVDKKLNSRKRRQQFLAQVKRGIKSATSRVLDLSVLTPVHKDQSVTNYVLTVALANSKVDSDARILAYFNSQTENENVKLEGNFSGLARLKPVTLENLEQAVQFDNLHDKFIVNVGFKNQSKDMELKSRGVLSQSDNLRRLIQNSNIVRQCLQALRGNKGLRLCRKALALVNKKDILKLSLKFNDEFSRRLNETKVIRNVMDRTVLSQYISSFNIVSPKNVDENIVDIEVKTPLNAERMDLTLHTPKTNIAFSMPKQYEQTLPRLIAQEQSTCRLSRKEIVTFDNLSYRPLMGQCWHIMASTEDQSAETIPVVLVKDNYTDGILVTVLGRGSGARFTFRNESGSLLLSLGTNPILSTSRTSGYVGYHLRIWSTTTSLKLVTEDNKLELTYTGNTVEVRVSNALLNRMTGICGNNDRVLANDLERQNCQLNAPEFVASFALLSQDCQGPALFNKKKAEMSLAACDQRQTRRSNIISDMEAGRVPRENKNWSRGITSLNRNRLDLVEHRTWYEYNATQICFSTVPVPQCLPGTKAKIIEEKVFNYHCGPMSNKNLELKSSIDKGAHPDLSHKSVTKSELLFVPKVCTRPEDSDL